MRVAIAGPCGAGKTTLQRRLQQVGFNAVAIAQEHSHVPDMWRRVTQPDLLIYLDASLETIRQRMSPTWESWLLDLQRQRLRHARQHCHLYLPTDGLTPEQVVERAVVFLQAWRAAPTQGQ
ncbi:MAG: hypothetical protein GX605_06300 [Chloroflexi bacterium]|nr:hypothetical protein [Chloroflexota bacterium]